MWTESNKDANIHVRMVFSKFKSLPTPTFNKVVRRSEVRKPEKL